MSRRLLAVVAVVLAAVLAWWLWPESESKALDTANAGAEVEARGREALAVELAGESESEREVGVELMSDDVVKDEVDAAELDDGLAVVRGRLLHHDGRPATDATFDFTGSRANNARVVRYGVPKDWTNPTAAIEEDGSFEIRFDPPRAFQFSLRIKAPGAPLATWRWTEIEPASDTDLGTIQLIEGGALECRIVRSDGTLVPHRFLVYATTFWAPESSDEGLVDVSARGTADDPVVRFESLPPGPVELSVDGRISLIERSIGAHAVVVAGTTTTVDIVYDGPNPSSSLVVRIYSSRPRWAAPPDPMVVTVRDAGGRVVSLPGEALRRGGTGLDLRLDDVSPGPYSILVDDPRFERHEQFELEPGAHNNVSLAGSVAVVVVAVDATTGAVVEDVGVSTMEWAENARAEDARETKLRRTTPDGSPVFATVPEPQVWFVAAEGYETRRIVFESGFVARTTETLRVELEVEQPPLTIAGRVLAHDGSPRAGVEVAAQSSTPSSTHEGGRAFYGGEGFGDEVLRVTTAADGTFVLEGLEQGDYDVAAGAQRASSAWALDVPAGTTDLELRLPPIGRVEGRLVPAFRGVENCRIRLVSTVDRGTDLGDHGLRLMHLVRNGGSAYVDGEGRFTIEDVSAGSYRVEVSHRGSDISFGTSSISGHSHSIECGTIQIVADTTTPLELDVSELNPGTVRVRVLVDGAPMPGLLVRVIQSGERPIDLAGARTDAEGLAEAWPIAAGTVIVSVSATSGGMANTGGNWSLPAPGVHSVVGGEVVDLKVSVTLATGDLTFVDADGAPLAERVFQAGLEGASGTSVVRTDGDGVARLTLPVGTYVVTTNDRGFETPTETRAAGGPTATIEWTVDGPLEERVVLPIAGSSLDD
jgi:hypothetical protein